jgi:hypothetical protein
MLNLARQIGESLSKPTTHKKTILPTSDDIFLQIKPFKENEK